MDGTIESVKARQGRPRDPERVRRVIEVAEQLFLEQGFERTSMEAVAKASGVSKMTIYSYFPSKQELFEATIGRRVDAAFEFQGEVELSPDDPRRALTVMGRHFLGLIRSDDVIRKQRLLFAEAGIHEEVCCAFYHQGPLNVVARVRGYLDAAVAVGTLAVDDTEAAADQFLSLFLGTAHFRAMLGLGKPEAEEEERLLERNVDTFLRAYAAGPASPSSRAAPEPPESGA